MIGAARLARFLAVDERYCGADDPELALAAYVAESFRQYAEAVGVCPACLALFPDVLAAEEAAA